MVQPEVTAAQCRQLGGTDHRQWQWQLIACCHSSIDVGVTSAGWQVTLCDLIWYVSSRSGDRRLRLQTAIRLFTFTFTRFWCSSAVAAATLFVWFL